MLTLNEWATKTLVWIVSIDTRQQQLKTVPAC